MTLEATAGFPTFFLNNFVLFGLLYLDTFEMEKLSTLFSTLLIGIGILDIEPTPNLSFLMVKVFLRRFVLPKLAEPSNWFESF